MLREKFERSFEEHKNIYIAVGIGTLLATGVFIGSRIQSKIFAKELNGMLRLVKEVDPLFPVTMSIPEIKEAISHIDGATFMDALVTNVDGVQSIITRF